MLKIRFKTVKNKFHHPFITSHGIKEYQEALLVAISVGDALGIGEAPVISYYPETLESMVFALQSRAREIEQYKMNEPTRFWHYLHHLLPNNPFLVCALDLAYWDMYSQYTGKSIQAMNDLPTDTSVLTDFTLGIDTEEKMLNKMRENPWPIYKVKVKDENSISILETLAAETTAKFRIDANESWSRTQAREFLPRLEKLPIELIEQPLARADYEGHGVLKDSTTIPIIADESFQNIKDIDLCATYFDGINLKLTKCSGLTPALEIIKQARFRNMKLMLGCMNEAEDGTYIAAKIAAVVDYVDLDGPMLLDIKHKKLNYAQGILSWQ